MIGSLRSFFPDSVAKELMPVDLRLRHRQLTSQCFERSVRHFHVIVRNRALVVALRCFNELEQVWHELNAIVRSAAVLYLTLAGKVANSFSI